MDIIIGRVVHPLLYELVSTMSTQQNGAVEMVNSEYIEQPPTEDSRRQSQERTEHNDIIQSEITDDTHMQMGACTV